MPSQYSSTKLHQSKIVVKGLFTCGGQAHLNELSNSGEVDFTGA